MSITKNVRCKECNNLIPIIEKEEGDEVRCTCGYIHVVSIPAPKVKREKPVKVPKVKAPKVKVTKVKEKPRVELITNYLSEHPCCFKTELSEALGMPLPAIHRGINHLKDEIIQRRIGHNVYVCLKKDALIMDSFAKEKVLESNHGRKSTFRTLDDGTEEKWCSGCKKFHPLDAFGYCKTGARGFQYRCMAFNRELVHNRLKKYGKIYKKRSMHIKKPLFKKLKMHPPEGTVKKKCPSCHSIIYVDPNQKEGFCHIHSVKYTISKSLSDSNRSGKAHGIMLKLVKPELFIKDRILDCIHEKPRYQHQIAQKFMISSGYTKKIVCELESSGLVSVTRGKNYTWVEAC